MNRFLTIPDNPVTILIRPPVSRWKLYKWYSWFGSREPSLGLLYIASYIESNGYKIKIIDAESEDAHWLYTQIKNINPDIVGITATTFSFFNASEISAGIRSMFPDCLLLMGGPHVSALPLESMQLCKSLDGVVVGEGEETMLDIIQKQQTDKIEGLVWRDSDIISNKSRKPTEELDRYKLNWNLLTGFPQNYFPPSQSKRSRSAALVVSRGCFYNCSFCSSATLWGNKIRYHSPEYVVNVMKELEQNYNIREFYFHDDYFPAHPQWIKQFCNLLSSEKKSFNWSCSSRTEVLSDEILCLMKKSGCWQIGIGVESASQNVLDKISKKISISSIKEGINRITSAGIDLKGLFILDTPGESLNDLLKTTKFIVLNNFSEIQLNYFCPLPGSGDHQEFAPSPSLWNKMSLQSCLGYSKLNPMLYPFIELILYFIAYTKILLVRFVNKFHGFFQNKA